MSSFSLGAFIGPSVGGLLYDLVEFRMGTLFVIVIHILVVAHRPTSERGTTVLNTLHCCLALSNGRKWEFSLVLENVKRQWPPSEPIGIGVLIGAEYSGELITDGSENRKCGVAQAVERMVSVCVLAFCFVCLEKRPSTTVNQERSAVEEAKAMLQFDDVDNKMLGPESAQPEELMSHEAMTHLDKVRLILNANQKRRKPNLLR
uniref:Uncharacterized protein n=1 Tax=Timema bartmani TaxID=61472 RepID=A0A7R9EUT4_9NEOP|nr:unnamed protein product [Timema bartmani]